MVGRDFVSALMEKYGDDDVTPDGFQILVARPRQTSQSDNVNPPDLIIPALVSLNDYDVTTAGNLSELGDQANVVTELDISKNRISDWKEVYKLISAFPNLNLLNLSYNPLHPVCDNVPSSSDDVTSPSIDVGSPSGDDTVPSTDVTPPSDDVTAQSDLEAPSTDVTISSSKNVTLESDASHLQDVEPLSRYDVEPSSDDVTPPPCPRLKRLVLNGTRVPHQMVDRLLSAWTSLEELHLSLNDYTTVNFSPVPHQNLKILYFNSNNSSDWSQIVKLGRKFPSLENLTMTEIGISELGSENGDFPVLKCLCLSSTGVTSWAEVEKLNSFPALREVRMKDVPLLKDYDERLGRQLLLAHLPRVTRLNASRVSELEREDAERAAIRYYQTMEDKPVRYHVLVSKHGELDQLVHVDLTPEQTITVLVTHNERQTLIPVNQRWTVRELKKRISEWSGVPLSKFRLYFKDHRDLFGTVHCQYMDKVLHSMRLCDGVEFQVWETKTTEK